MASHLPHELPHELLPGHLSPRLLNLDEAEHNLLWRLPKRRPEQRPDRLVHGRVGRGRRGGVEEEGGKGDGGPSLGGVGGADEVVLRLDLVELEGVELGGGGGEGGN